MSHKIDDVTLPQVVSKEKLCEFHIPLCCTRTHYISASCARRNFHRCTCRTVVWPNVSLSLTELYVFFRWSTAIINTLCGPLTNNLFHLFLLFVIITLPYMSLLHRVICTSMKKIRSVCSVRGNAKKQVYSKSSFIALMTVNP